MIKRRAQSAHNLYLHSAVSQTRQIDHNNEEDVAEAVRFSAWDSNIQLSACPVNVPVIVEF